MDYDTEKVDCAALAMLWLTAFSRSKFGPPSAWKSMDWDTLDRLHEKGFIYDPKNKNKSIDFTEKGAEEAEKLFKVFFTKLPKKAAKPKPKKQD